MNNTGDIEINWSNFDYDYYLQGMTSLGSSVKSSDVMLSNFIYSKIRFINIEGKISRHEELLNGKLYEEKKAIDAIIFKEEKKIKQIEFIDKLTLAFQDVAFESDKLILNKKYFKLTDDYILNRLEEKGYTKSHLNLIQPFDKIMIVVSALNEKAEDLFQLNMESIITLKAYLDLEILVSNIDCKIPKELYKFGLVEEDMIWLIHYKQIIIEALGIYFLNNSLIDISELDSRLRYFVEIFIIKTIINRASFTTKKNKSKIDEKKIKKHLENIDDNIDYAQKKGNDISDSIEIKFLSICNKYFSSGYFKIFNKQFSSFEQFMKFTMSRNFDSILKDIFTHHSYDTIPFKSESDKYRAFYKLFGLMMPHRRWEYTLEYIENQPQEITQKMRKFITKK